MPPSNDPMYAGLGQAVRIGTEMLAALIGGGGVGWVIDTYLFASTPWGLVFGLAFGAAAGVLNTYRTAQRWPRSDDSTSLRR
ncbi:MAG: AtpZ/AtpI family protein [Nitrospiraceae bacterium]